MTYPLDPHPIRPDPFFVPLDKLPLDVKPDWETKPKPYPLTACPRRRSFLARLRQLPILVRIGLELAIAGGGYVIGVAEPHCGPRLLWLAISFGIAGGMYGIIWLAFDRALGPVNKNPDSPAGLGWSFLFLFAVLFVLALIYPPAMNKCVPGF